LENVLSRLKDKFRYKLKKIQIVFDTLNIININFKINLNNISM